jgi:hypothetical protein
MMSKALWALDPIKTQPFEHLRVDLLYPNGFREIDLESDQLVFVVALLAGHSGGDSFQFIRFPGTYKC